MATKKTILKAQQTKNDEWFTIWPDIAAEISLYKSQLKGKRILSPCDWDASYKEKIFYKKGLIKKKINSLRCNFLKFLVSHAEDYKIKTITASGYNPAAKKGIKFQDIDYSKYDLIITNPPFSQFREFIKILIKNKKKFLVIGPQFALSYKDIFHFIKNNKLWLGYAKQLSGFVSKTGKKIMANKPEGSVARACKWYTNLDVSYRHDNIILTESYSPREYSRYYNYRGINVDKTKNIPYDYKGIMGVPITFLTKFSPKQFKIIDIGVQAKKTKRWPGDKAALWTEKNGKPHKEPFERVLIKHKKIIK